MPAGVTNNPKGRPPKNRALTEILEKAGAASLEINGSKVSGKRLLAIWLGDSFPGAVWVAPAAGLILIVVKVIEVVRAEVPAPPPGVSASDFAVAQPSRASRILWG